MWVVLQELRGTIRCFEPATRKRMQQRLVEVAESTATAFGAKAEVEIQVCNELHHFHALGSFPPGLDDVGPTGWPGLGSA